MAIFKQPHSSYRALTWNDVTEYWDDIGQFLKKFGDRCTEFVVKAGKPIEVTILLNRKGPIGNTNILGEVVEEFAQSTLDSDCFLKAFGYDVTEQPEDAKRIILELGPLTWKYVLAYKV